MELAYIFQAGHLKIIRIESAAAATLLALQPPTGKIWHIIDVYAYHDDTTADIHWTYYNGTLTHNFATVTRLANAPHRLQTEHTIAGYVYQGPIILDRTTYLRIVAPGALGAGKKFYISAVVMELIVDVA